MRKPIILAAAVLLMVLATAADSTPTTLRDAVAVESSGATFSNSLQVPAITAAPLPHR